MGAVFEDDELVVDPRAEASARLDGRFDVRVLEPSPPAVGDAPWFADDPVNAPGEGERPVVAPVPGHDATWDELARIRSRPRAVVCRPLARRMAAPRRRPRTATRSPRTRGAWHRLAEHVVAPVRHRANGKIGLRYTRGGFGTPFFGADEQVRIGRKVADRRPRRRACPSTRSRRCATRGTRSGSNRARPADVYTPTTPLVLDEPLVVDDDAARVPRRLVRVRGVGARGAAGHRAGRRGPGAGPAVARALRPVGRPRRRLRRPPCDLRRVAGRRRARAAVPLRHAVDGTSRASSGTRDRSRRSGSPEFVDAPDQRAARARLLRPRRTRPRT